MKFSGKYRHLRQARKRYRKPYFTTVQLQSDDFLK